MDIVSSTHTHLFVFHGHSTALGFALRYIVKKIEHGAAKNNTAVPSCQTDDNSLLVPHPHNYNALLSRALHPSCGRKSHLRLNLGVIAPPTPGPPSCCQRINPVERRATRNRFRPAAEAFSRAIMVVYASILGRVGGVGWRT